MSSVFLFGAGASYGNPDCTPYPPPLGNNLFKELQKGGGVASRIRPPLSEVFEQNFEKGMEEFFEKRNVEVTEFLRDMAKYFVQFRPGPKNLYRNLIEELGSKNKVIFSTTNYDLLIELCINQAGFSFYYSGFPIPDNSIPVLKIHGSCNFLPDRRWTFKDISFKISVGASILDTPVQVASPNEVIDFCRINNSTAPVISMYASGKNALYCPTFIKEQQKIWKKEIHRSNRIFVIGLRVNEEDAHIWEALARAKASIGYVGREPEEFEEWANKNKRKKIWIIGDYFEDSISRIIRNIKLK